jgi:hypothetical protein
MKLMTCHYTVYPTKIAPPLIAGWEDPVWRRAQVAEIDHFHPASSSHRPVARARLLYDERSFYLQFRVLDRYVRCTRTQYQEPVFRDSCVEFFVRPKTSAGYFNFETNCGGVLLLSYIEDPTRTSEGFAKFTPVAQEHGQCIRIEHSMPRVVFPEQAGPIDWQVGCQIPLNVLEAYVGPLGTLHGQVWLGNFYKCADESSHPHWASWSPIGEELNFHRPDCFAPIQFAVA